MTDRELPFCWPSGAVIHPAPPVPVQETDPTDALRREHLKRGLEIHPWTTTPNWDGEPMDLDWVMGVIWEPPPPPPAPAEPPDGLSS